MFVGRTTTPPTETLRIGIDARCLNVRHLRGMGNYLRGMIGGLAGLPELHWDFLSNRPDLPFHNPLPGTTPALHNFDCPGHRFQLWEQAAAWHCCRMSAANAACISGSPPLSVTPPRRPK